MNPRPPHKDVIYAKNKKDFLEKEIGIEGILSKATFARVLSAVNGKAIGDAILDILCMRFGVSGEVIAVDGKAICIQCPPPGIPTAPCKFSVRI